MQNINCEKTISVNAKVKFAAISNSPLNTIMQNVNCKNASINAKIKPIITNIIVANKKA